MPDPRPKYQTRDLNMAVLNEKMDTVLERVDVALGIMERHDTRIRTVETDGVLMKRETEAAHRRIDATDFRLKVVEDSIPDDLKKKFEKVEEVIPVVKAVRWLGGLVVALIIGLLWAIFTGQMNVTR